MAMTYRCTEDELDSLDAELLRRFRAQVARCGAVFGSDEELIRGINRSSDPRLRRLHITPMRRWVELMERGA